MESTNTTLVSYDKINKGMNLNIDGVDGKAGNVTISEVNPFTGYPCEYSYFNKYHKHNITQPTTVDDITGWVEDSNSLPGILASSQAVVTKNRVYLLGGRTSTPVSTVYTAPIDSDGVIGTWSTGTSLPGALDASQAIVTKNRVYLLGGGNGGSATPTVYTAPILEDGTIGVWTTDTNRPPEAQTSSQAVVTKNRVYLIGGYNKSTVYTATIDDEGVIGTWTTDTSLPGSLTFSQAVVTKNRVYLLCGYNGSVYTSTVYTATIDDEGVIGTWTTDTSLPRISTQSQAVVTKNRVYLLATYNGSVATNTVYTAPIDSDGVIGTWSTGTSLPGALSHSQAVVTKNRVYLLGGNNGSVTTNTVYTAPFTDGWSIEDNSYEAIVNAYSTDITSFGLENPPSVVRRKAELDLEIVGTPTLTNVSGTTDISGLLQADDKILLDHNEVDVISVTETDITTDTTSTHDIFGDGSAVATYNLDGDATDLGGNYNSSAVLNYVDGKFGQGTNSVDIPLGFDIGTLPSWTVSFFVKADLSFDDSSVMMFNNGNTSVHKQILFRTLDSGMYGLNIYDYESNISSKVTVGSNTYPSTDGVVFASGVQRDSNFHHIVGSYHNGTFESYIDGLLIGKIEGYGDTWDLKVGYDSKWISSNNVNDVILDQVRIFNRALTDEEVNDLYNGYSPKFQYDITYAEQARIPSTVAVPDRSVQLTEKSVEYDEVNDKLDYKFNEYTKQGRVVKFKLEADADVEFKEPLQADMYKKLT